MNRRILLFLVLSTCAIAADARSSNGKLHLDFNIPLWPEGKARGAVGDEPLDRPSLTVVLPPEGKRNGAAVIICPGGGNIKLFHHPEGMAVAERLNSFGVAAFILTYRLSPRYPNQEIRVMDGERAVRLVRARAAEWNVDPRRIGMMGFSAGGPIVRSAAWKGLPGDAQSADPVDRVSSRPDFAVLVYGGGRPDPNESLQNFPPTFLLAAAADAGNATAAAESFLAFRKAGVSAELHIYQEGRHGFGAAEEDPHLGDWLGRCELWMKYAGFFKESK